MSETALAAPVRQAAAPEAGAKNRLVLQRKCACGQHTAGGGECAECRKKRMAMQRWPSHRPPPDAMLRAASAMPAPAAEGADLSRVPAQTPALRTAPMVQRADADGSGAFEPAEVEQAAQDSVDPASAPPSPATETPAGAPESPGAEAAPATPAAAPGASLLVEDGATEVGVGQMRKTEFLDQLQRTVCAEADQVLAAAGRSTQGCPYIAQAFGRYRGQGAAQVESALRRYAPETRNARSAAEYIPIVAARVRQGVERWVATGEISGVPDDVSLSIPTGGLFGAIGSAASALGGLLFKAKEGGARPGDPAAVHDDLGEGRPLESGVRGRMETAFGRSFAHVRTHTDSTARRLSAEQNARAFTVGRHVAFGTGEYRPGTVMGDALIAHELAHTVQQGSGQASVQRMGGDAGYDALEHDADQSAAGAVAALWPGLRRLAGKPRGRAGARLSTGLRIQRCKNDSPSGAKAEGAADAAPKLTKKTISGPTPTDCGGFSWVVQWELDKETSKGGWVVQKVELLYDVKDCDDKPVDAATAPGGLQPSWYPVWEAWPINKGQKVTTYAEGGDVIDDTYGSDSPGASTKGPVTVKGTAEYYDGLELPEAFKVTNAAPTWILPATKSDPALAGGSGSIDHSLKAAWNCCGDDKKTTLTPS